jgi:hypothetical protein
MYLSLSLQYLPAVYSVSILFRGKVNICQSVGYYWDNFIAEQYSILYAVFIHKICADCTCRSKYKASLKYYFTFRFGEFPVFSKTFLPRLVYYYSYYYFIFLIYLFWTGKRLVDCL